MAAAMGYGGERHRQTVVDSYIIAYDIYKNKKPFTDGTRIHTLLKNLNCVGDARMAEKLAVSKKTIASRGLKIASALRRKTTKELQGAMATSILFDEASNVTMHSILNVFCNAILYTGEVRTVTLTLEELSDGTSKTIFEALCKVSTPRHAPAHTHTHISARCTADYSLCCFPFRPGA